MIGSTLSHFRITSRLGAGGMGEVYRAEDGALGREVAIKVLPTAFVADPERVARFEREARTLASLSHPGIAGIYEVGREDGTLFLVMELARGETLADRIARGAIPLAEALPIAVQIAEALEAAHERGVIHRDLKPANVMADGDGKVKLLDFGLAKALEADPEAQAQALSASPTLTRNATVAGVLLGTAAYMSPEQAAGRPADRRADVWAFGALLFEMLAGRQAFGGETVSHVLAAVLKDEPPWDALPADVPPRLRHLLERCLRKSARQRLQAIGDARIVLEECLATPQEGTPAAVAAVARPGAARLVVPLAALSVVLLGLVAWLLASRRDAAPAPALQLELPLPPGGQMALDSQQGALALSRDGRRIVQVVRDDASMRRLVLRDLGTAESRVLPGTEGASSPTLSPDGDWVAYFAGQSLWRLALAGGSPVVVAAETGDNRGAHWADDGYIYVAADVAAPLSRVPESGGAIEPVAQLDAAAKERTHRWPHALPGGRAVLVTSDTAETTEFYDDARIVAIEPATGKRTVLVEQASAAQYLPDGHLIFARGGALYAVRFDPETLAVTGAPVLAAQDVLTTVASGVAHFAVAESGSLVWVSGKSAEGATVPVWVAADGTTQPSNIPAGAYSQLALSPDGSRVVLGRQQDGIQDLWVADLARGILTRLTFGEDASDPMWSADGKWIYYGGQKGVWRTRADGGGKPERVWEPGGAAFPCSTTPDGESLVAELVRENSDIWLVPLAGGEARPLVQTPRADLMGEMSPDGRWLAYSSTENGRPEIYVVPLVGEGKWQISGDTGYEPRWSADSRTLYFRSIGAIFRVALGGGDTLAPGAVELIAPGMRTGTNTQTYGPSRDGTRFLTLGLTSDQKIDRVRYVLDWRREVERILRGER